MCCYIVGVFELAIHYLFCFLLATLRDLENAGKLIDLGYHICDAFANHSEYAISKVFEFQINHHRLELK